METRKNIKQWTVLCRARSGVCKLKTDTISSNFWITVFWNVMQCCLVCKFQHFFFKVLSVFRIEQTVDCSVLKMEAAHQTTWQNRLLDSSALKWGSGVQIPPKCLYIPTQLHHISEDSNSHSHCLGSL
jgi:hypothetical protein